MIDTNWFRPGEIRRRVHENEVYLAFNCDQAAEYFWEWWDHSGSDEFEMWCRDQET